VTSTETPFNRVSEFVPEALDGVILHPMQAKDHAKSTASCDFLYAHRRHNPVE